MEHLKQLQIELIGGSKFKHGNIGNNSTTSTNVSGSGVKRATAGGGAGGLAVQNNYKSDQPGSAGGQGTSYGGGRRWRWSRKT